MALDTAKATVVLRDLTATFDNAAKAVTPFYPRLSHVANSKGKDEKYGFLGAMPGVREWIGDRVWNELRAANFTIENKPWENSLLIDKDDIEDDRMGMYGPLLAELGTEAMTHPDELLFSLIVGGESQTCFDGQFFFDTDHVWGNSGSQSNDLTAAAATGTVPTAAEFKAGFHAARAAMLKFKTDTGKLLNRQVNGKLSDLVVVVNPDFEVIAHEALSARINSSGADNIVIDQPQIISSAYLTDTSKMYVFNMEGALKPFVFQARKPLTRQMKGLDDIEDKHVKFMTDARYNVGYLAWWKAVLFTWT